MKFDPLPQKIEDCLREEVGCLCDACLSKRVGTAAIDRVEGIARRLGSGRWGSRYKGRCSACGEVSAVTAVNSCSI